MDEIKNLFTGLDTEKPIGTLTGSINQEMAAPFAATLRELGGINITPKVVINSPGGGVFPGMEIIDAMLDFPVDTHIAGMAASMGGVISQFGKRRTANDFSMLMIHAPKGGEKHLLDKIAVNLKAMLMRRSKLTIDQLDDIFNKGKDVWFNAQEMLELGLIDEIVNTGIRVNNFDKSQESGILEQIFDEAVASLCLKETAYAVKQLKETEINLKNNMDNDFKEVKNQLGLGTSDTERDVINSIKALSSENGDLKAELELKDGEIDRLNNSITSINDSKAETLVNEAVEAGKISNESKDSFIAFAKSDFDGAKKAIDGIKKDTVYNSIAEELEANSPKEPVDSEKVLLGRGYADIQEKNPEILNELATSNEDLLNKLLDEYNIR